MSKAHDPKGPESKNERVFDSKKAANLHSPERQARTPYPAIVSAARLFEGIRVADIGSGTGYYSFALLNSGIRLGSIDAVDSSEDMNRMFAERLKDHPLRASVRIHNGAGENIPLESGSVDLAVLGNIFHEFDDSLQALKEIFRILCPGGRVLVVDWAIPADRTVTPEAGPPYAHRRSEQDARGELSQVGFKFVQSESDFRDVYALTAVKPNA